MIELETILPRWKYLTYWKYRVPLWKNQSHWPQGIYVFESSLCLLLFRLLLYLSEPQLSRVCDVSFITFWIWLDLRTCFDWQKVVEEKLCCFWGWGFRGLATSICTLLEHCPVRKSSPLEGERPYGAEQRCLSSSTTYQTYKRRSRTF